MKSKLTGFRRRLFMEGLVPQFGNGLGCAVNRVGEVEILVLALVAGDRRRKQRSVGQCVAYVGGQVSHNQTEGVKLNVDESFDRIIE